MQKKSLNVLKNKDMERELYEWLEYRFYRDNHLKYRKYFKEWVTNITPNQIDGFRRQMQTDLSNLK